VNAAFRKRNARCSGLRSPSDGINSCATPDRPAHCCLSSGQEEISDIELLRRIGLRDRDAFSLLYDRFSGLLFSAALRILNDQKEAEDLLQEVFVDLWHKAAKFDPLLGKPLSWVLTLTRNKAIDRLRASRRRGELIEEARLSVSQQDVQESRTVETVEVSERARSIRAALAELPTDQRQAIEMAFFAGLTQTEIAEALGEPLGTIKARIRRGMLKLREKIEKNV